MAERSFMVYSEEKDFYTDEDAFLIRLDLGDGRKPAHYAVDNIFALETWERFEPNNFAWNSNKLTVLGEFTSLSQMRDTYLEGRALREENANQPSETEIEDDRDAYRDELEQTSVSLLASVQSAVIHTMSDIARTKGIDEKLVDDIRAEARVIIDSPEYEDTMLASREFLVGQVLWTLLESDGDARSLPYLLDCFEQCTTAPYTFYRNNLEDGVERPPRYHVPRIKLSQSIVREALSELVETFDEYGTTAVDGSQLVKEIDLEKARAIIAS